VCISNSVTNLNNQSSISHYVPKSTTLLFVSIGEFIHAMKSNNSDIRFLMYVRVFPRERGK
jgi:hypothetical protein